MKASERKRLTQEMAVEYLSRRHVAPVPAEQRQRQEERFAESLRERARRHEQRYGVLPPGTWVKPEITWLRAHWLEVVKDPGPASNTERSLTIRRREPERDNEIYRVRRDRMTVYAPKAEDTPGLTVADRRQLGVAPRGAKPTPGLTGETPMPGENRQ